MRCVQGGGKMMGFQMFRLILIDDEPNYLKTFQNLFQWDTLHFDLVATFTNGLTALSYLETHEVDAILTDIKMPKLDGVSLAKICHEKYPHIKIAFLSAYRDFEYAQSALQYGVSDYIVKSTTISALRESLEKFSNKLAREYDLDAQRENFEDIELFKKQQFFSNLLCGLMPTQEVLRQQLLDAGFPETLIEKPCELILLAFDDFNNYLTNVWHYTRERFYRSIEQMFLPAGDDFILSITRYAHDKVEIIAICTGDCSKFHDVVHEAMVTSIQNIKSVLGADARILSCTCFDALIELFHFTEQPAEEKILGNDDTIARAERFIAENCHKNISLSDVADYVSLSPAYFSAYYKKQSGTSYNNTINRYRIEKAKKLLRDHSIKIAQIYSLVGYESYPYFYKMFKRFTNMTPASYRDAIGGKTGYEK